MLELKRYIVFLSPKINLVLANSSDPDERSHFAQNHLGLHCLPKDPLRGFSSVIAALHGHTHLLFLHFNAYIIISLIPNI